jgi:hypothetical protein
MTCLLFAVFGVLICVSSLMAAGSLGWAYDEVIWDLGTVEDCEDSNEDMATAAAKASAVLCTS